MSTYIPGELQDPTSCFRAQQRWGPMHTTGSGSLSHSNLHCRKVRTTWKKGMDWKRPDLSPQYSLEGWQWASSWVEQVQLQLLPHLLLPCQCRLHLNCLHLEVSIGDWEMLWSLPTWQVPIHEMTPATASAFSQVFDLCQGKLELLLSITCVLTTSQLSQQDKYAWEDKNQHRPAYLNGCSSRRKWARTEQIEEGAWNLPQVTGHFHRIHIISILTVSTIQIIARLVTAYASANLSLQL